MAREFFKIKNKSADTLEIDIEGTIGYDGFDWLTGETSTNGSKEAVKKLVKEVANSAASQIIVNINSYGGDVNHGISIHDILAEHKAKVTTVIHGHTASAATIISQAGNTRKMSANSLFLIHPASTVAWGNRQDIAAAMSDLEKVDQTIRDIYVKRTGKTAAEIEEVMNRFDGRGEWLTAQEALEYGFIDEVFEPMKAVASVDGSILSRYGLPGLPENKLSTDMKADKKTVFAWFEEFTAKLTGKAKAEPETPEPGATPEPEAEPETGEPTPEGESSTTDTQEIRLMDLPEVTETLADITAQFEAAEARIAELAAALTTAQDEVARLKGTATQTKPKEDPVIDKSNLKTNEDAHEANAANLRGK